MRKLSTCLLIVAVALAIPSQGAEAKDTDRQVGDARGKTTDERDLDRLVHKEIKEFEEALREYRKNPTDENYEKAFWEMDDFRDLRLNYDLSEKQHEKLNRAMDSDWGGYPP